MTRSSVQKSVCVVCRAPLFGRMAVKLELVVRAWFLQGDFSQTKLLEDAYLHLNSCPVQMDQIFEGISHLKDNSLSRTRISKFYKIIRIGYSKNT